MAAARTSAPDVAGNGSRLDGDERRRQILAAARKLFSEGGYSATSTAGIAAEAGVAGA